MNKWTQDFLYTNSVIQNTENNPSFKTATYLSFAGIPNEFVSSSRAGIDIKKMWKPVQRNSSNYWYSFVYFLEVILN